MRIAYFTGNNETESEQGLQAAGEIWQRIHFLPDSAAGIFVPFHDVTDMIEGLILQEADLAVVSEIPQAAFRAFQLPGQEKLYQLEIVGRFLLRGPPGNNESQTISNHGTIYYLINCHHCDEERGYL